MIRRSDITQGFARALVDEHGSISNAARSILPQMEIATNGKPPTFNSVRCILNQALKGENGANQTLRNDTLGRIAALLERQGINIDDVGEIKKIKLAKHQGFIKSKDGEIEYTKDLPSESIVFTPSWDKGPEWPVVQPAKPTNVTHLPYKAQPRIGRTIVILPDVQVGYLRSLDDPSKLTPMHDLVALDVAAQIVADLQPDQLGWIGDFLDLPEMSRWLQVEEFWRTTQPAIDEAHRILAQFEAAAGPRERRKPTFFIAGNHDRRLREYVTKNARAAFHLRPAASTPESWPDLTVPHLLRFEDLGIEYCGEFPGSEYWITDRLVCRHDPASKGVYDATVIAGHTHRVRTESVSKRTSAGQVHSNIVEIGCLCRIDNYADRSSLMRTSVPSDRGFVTGWTQAVCVVHIDDDGQFQIDTVQIHNGKALYAGKVYEARPKAA